jgi:dTDP-glucose pyrophosphorylase
MKVPVLVILAGGMGSRYGGLKQMDSIGACGEVIMDYSVFDALRAGFKKVVFIIRHSIEDDFKKRVLSRIKGSVNYEIAFQELDTLIPPDIVEASKKNKREKPWGTAHALLCAAEFIDAPFAVINADDFYGCEAFSEIGKFLSSPDISEGAISEGAIVPYRLENTLSATGSVSRGVCVIEDGYLKAVDELKSIEKQNGKIVSTSPSGLRQLPPDTPVSMNFWGFPASILPSFRTYFDNFLKTSGTEARSECYIPLAVDTFIKQSTTRVRSLSANAHWFGITYKEDLSAAVENIENLTRRGVYPRSLW